MPTESKTIILCEEAQEFLYRRGKYSDTPSPSLMLLDLKMPKMDGFEVLEIVKKDDKLKKIPVRARAV